MIAKLLRAVIQVLASLIVFLGLYIPLFYLVFGIILLAATDFSFGGMGADQVMYYIGLALCCVAAVIIAVRNAIVRPISHVFQPLREYREEVSGARPSERDHREYEERYGEERYSRDERDRSVYQRRADYREEPYGRRNEYYADRYEEDNRYADPLRDPYDRNEEGGREPSRYEERATRYPYDRRDREYGGQERMREPEPERPLIYYSRRRPGVLVKEYNDRFELFQESADGERRYIGTEYKDE